MGRFVAAAADCVFQRKAGVKLDSTVLHTMQGTLSGTISWFQKAGRAVPTAAHYCIGRNGEVVQMVDDAKKCLHAGNYNSRSIGIEMEAHTGAWPVRRLASGAVKPPPYPADEFPEALVDSVARIVRVLCAKYGIPVDRSHIIGHVEVPGATHTDPGPFWDWPSFMDRVRS